jgi:UDP-glucose 4-epimerase
MNFLVLGGAGFIGSHIVDALVARRHKVRVFDLPNVSTQNLKQCLNSIEIIGGDFKNENDVALALENVDVIVHLIGTTLPEPSNENPAYDVDTNVNATLRLLDHAVNKGVKKVLFISSGGTVYGIPQSLPIPETHPTNPLCSYGITKLTIEKYLALYHSLHNLDYTILRLGNPYGERQRTTNVQGAVAVFLGKIYQDQPITIWGDGSVARDFFYISDFISAFLRVIDSDTDTKIFNIASGQAHSINEILSIIREVSGKNVSVNHTPGRKFDVPVNCLDISRAIIELGWQPHVSLKEGIRKTWEWMKASTRSE